ncbi:ABC transporter permease [Nocardia panacis]|uniref:Transport permease protein n=1 Tax=Nocardia panacis TaxID=2340916 RepID=A0A3A4KJL2_9NOCA|nr:ABC transporter permease [Nocardia panacis]RJO76844.1 ABC transporter permease [Nocardia panacis]
MSAATLVLTDSATMLRRNLLHFKRYPAMAFSMIVMPSILLVVFRFVFGGALEKSSGGNYVDYVVPGMLLLVPAYLTAGVAVSVATDTSKGIVNRFRTMAIAPSSMLTGHVIGAMIQAVLGVGFMMAVGFAIGWRPSGDVVDWLAVFGLVIFFSLALSWLAVGMGLVAPNPESASNLPFPILMLPFFGSGLVATDTMPLGLRQFAEYQPFTPLTETVRGLLMGTPIGNSGIIALAWCAGIAIVGYAWSTSVFRKQSN